MPFTPPLSHWHGSTPRAGDPQTDDALAPVARAPHRMGRGEHAATLAAALLVLLLGYCLR